MSYPMNGGQKFNPPKGYQCTSKGVCRLVEEGDHEWITLRPCEVTALSRDESNNNWGVLVWWIDLDDMVHEIAIPKRLFHSHGSELAQTLADGGLQIIPGREKALLRYLAAFNVDNKLIAAPSTGWLNNAFILPHESINEPPHQRIVYQPTGLSNISRAIHRQGALANWQALMLNVSDMVKFFICASLSAPVRYQVGIEAGGFHVYNLTSQGKTTLLQAAASVWGNGVDPAIAGGAESYIQRWNGTANALEAKAVAFNDLPMTIDEIGEGDAKEFGQTIYRIISGTGRSRAGRSGELRDSKSWRITVLSAGELAVSDFIESGGGKIKGGQMVRLVDLDLSNMPPLFDSAAEANSMKKLCANHYGHAGPEFLKMVPDLTVGWSDFNHDVIGIAPNSIASRVRARFALVAYTGILACQAGILPWTETEIIHSVQMAYRTWHKQLNTVSDIDRGVQSVREFILKHESRFEFPGADYPPNNRAGWYRDNMYHFSPAAFKEGCKGIDPTKVKKELHRLGFLHLNKTKGLNSALKVSGKAVTVVSVKTEILSDSINTGSNHGNRSNPYGIASDTGVTTKDEEVVTGSNLDQTSAFKLPLVTTSRQEVATAKTCINKGKLPRLPPLPPKKTEYFDNCQEVI